MWGLARVYDTGQLTSSGVVMRHSLIEKYFGTHWDWLTGSAHNKVAGANGSSMVSVGSAVLYLSVSGLLALAPIRAEILFMCLIFL